MHMRTYAPTYVSKCFEFDFGPVASSLNVESPRQADNVFSACVRTYVHASPSRLPVP